MNEVFYDKYQMRCRFTDEGMTFSNSRRDVYFPYGSLDSLNVSLLGVMQAVSHSQVCCFTVKREDKARIKALVREAQAAMKTASSAQCVILELEKLGVDQSLPAQEQLKQFRSLYVQGVISKPAFDLKKRLLSE